MAPGRRTVLLVDDDRGLRLLLQSELEAHGFRVLDYGSAEEALANCPTTEFDAIDLAVLDYDLPGADGLKLLRQLRTRRQDFPALMISGETGLTRRPDWPDQHTELLPKPFRNSLLLACIEGLTATDRGSA